MKWLKFNKQNCLKKNVLALGKLINNTLIQSINLNSNVYKC